MEDRYIGILTKDALKSARGAFISGTQQKLIYAAGAVCLGLAIFFMVKENYPNAIVMACGTVAFVLEYLFITARGITKALRRMEPYYGGEDYVVVFEKNTMRVRPKKAKNSFRIKYSDVIYLNDCPAGLLMISTEREVVVIAKEPLTDEQYLTMKTFVDGHCRNEPTKTKRTGLR